MKMIRDDQEDEIYRTLNEKYNAIISLVSDCIKEINHAWSEQFQLKNLKKYQNF